MLTFLFCEKDVIKISYFIRECKSVIEYVALCKTIKRGKKNL